MTTAQDEAGDVRREKMAIEEIRELLRDMHGDDDEGLKRGSQTSIGTEIEPDPPAGLESRS